MQLRKATRQKTKLRVGLAGPSGSGKTYSALLMARGMASAWDKIAMIDTEHGSGELYSHLGEYNVITLTAPFSPERYIDAIKACEKAGMEVIIIDSITHEWDGTGGCLEIVEQITKASKSNNSYTAWAKVTPRHNAFIQTILQSSCHVLTTVRKKQDYAMEKDSNGKTTIQKVGLKEITREGFEYELTLNLEISIGHWATAGKDRTGLFMDKPEFQITEETGKTLMAWGNEGIESPATIRDQLISEANRATTIAELAKTKAKLLASGLDEANQKLVASAMLTKSTEIAQAQLNAAPVAPATPPAFPDEQAKVANPPNDQVAAAQEVFGAAPVENVTTAKATTPPAQ